MIYLEMGGGGKEGPKVGNQNVFFEKLLNLIATKLD